MEGSSRCGSYARALNTLNRARTSYKPSGTARRRRKLILLGQAFLPSVAQAFEPVLVFGLVGLPTSCQQQIRICEIPAPPFKETDRGQELKRLFTNLGWKNVSNR